MHHFLSPARRPLPLALAAAGLTAALLTGCGGSDQQQASSPASSPAVQSTSATPAGATPAPSSAGDTVLQPGTDIPQHTHSTQPNQDVPTPPAAKREENTLPAPTPEDKLIVKSHTGAVPKWRVAAQMKDDGVVCVTVSSVGESQPVPDCQTGTQIAVELLTSAGAGQGTGNVDLIQRSVRSAPTDILVSGATTGDIREVDLDYRHKIWKTDLSKHTVSLPVKLKDVKLLAGSAKGIPNPITVKVFGLSIPAVNGNPPTSAVLESRRAKNGVLTFKLQ